MRQDLMNMERGDNIYKVLAIPLDRPILLQPCSNGERCASTSPQEGNGMFSYSDTSVGEPTTYYLSSQPTAIEGVTESSVSW